MKQRRIVETATDRVTRTAEIQNEERQEALAEKQANRNLDFVQFPRPAIEAFVDLVDKSPAAAQILLLMAQHMGLSNRVGVPSKNLCEALGISRATFSRAMKLLRQDRWIEPDPEMGVSAYRVNSLAFWTTGRAFKAASGVLRAPLGQGRTRGLDLKAVMVPVIAKKTSKSVRRKGQNK